MGRCEKKLSLRQAVRNREARARRIDRVEKQLDTGGTVRGASLVIGILGVVGLVWLLTWCV
jgi:hypothetical protein